MKRVAVCVVLMLGLLAVASAQQFTQWSAPVNMGPVVNSQWNDTCVSVSKNGLSLYYATYRPAPVGVGGLDLFVSKRATVNDPWGPPQLVPNVNSTVQESCPALSLDEHRLYFASARPGGCGGLDIYVSRRRDRTDDFGWQAPVNLGCIVNSPFLDGCETLFEDETGTVVMYFGSLRPCGPGSYDIYASRMKDDDTFGPAELVAELSGLDEDSCPAVRRDGLEVIFYSTRSGGLGNADLWTATRASTKDPWSVPVNLTGLNSSAYDGGKMSFSFDGRQLYFRSNRAGGYGYGDLYVATREKLRQ